MDYYLLLKKIMEKKLSINKNLKIANVPKYITSIKFLSEISNKKIFKKQLF